MLLALPALTHAQSRDRAKAGTLACDVSIGVGVIVTSKKDVTCMFTPAAAGPREVYVASISKFGPDAGAAASGEMLWSVFAPGNKKFGDLAGDYAGGAKALVGGLERGVSLQPVALPAEAGANLAPGVTALTLRPAR